MGQLKADEKQLPLQATGDSPNGPAGGSSAVDMRLNGNAFIRFISGPYFDVIPIQFERITKARRDAIAKGQAPADQGRALEYLKKLEHLALTQVDTDGKYGLNPDELVPLPFDVPLWPAYLVDVLAGLYQVAQATIVMFIAIYVENQDRSWKSGSSYTHSWQPLVKALIIIYPLITLIFLVNFTLEYCVRKFMYFRLLSMRILVDWENKEVWQTMFFYYFLGTWAMMNAWAIWGVAEYYGKYGNKGVDQTSFGTLVVVNLQTIQLLLYYLKLLSSETRLVSLNQLFERAPVEAQHLLEYTYVVEEDDVIEECYRFSQATQYTGLLRGVNIATFGLVGKSWLNDIDKATFSIDRLKQKAGNYEEVEEKVKQLRASVAARQQLGKAEASVAADGARKPGDVTLIVNNNNAATAAAIAANPTTTTSNSSKSSGLRRWWFSRMYASKHSLAVTFMDHYHSWPFRPDVKYFRMLTFIQAISVFAVGAIVVLGWQYSARDSTCAKSAKSCNTCLAVHERYFNSAEPLCDAMETAITRIVASANGTWLDNGVLEERYCNFECYGNFTPSQTCPALGR